MIPPVSTPAPFLGHLRLSLRFAALAIGLLAALPAGLHAAGTPEVIRIGTVPGLKFDLSAFSVRPGTEVEIIFTNSEEMLHNFVIVKPGTREAVGLAALTLGAGAAERDFVPPSPDVLWSTKVVPAGTSASLKFTTPTVLGEYPYVCTFPGHFVLMYGTMIVTNNPLPPVKTVVAPTQGTASGAPPSAMPPNEHAAHLAGPPAAQGVTQRAFMPNSGPASIAVLLPGGVAYCWDAGAGRFRYAWTGGYMTMPRAAERGLATLEGPVFYTEPEYPLRLGTAPGGEPKRIDYKGFVLDAQSIPEFATVVDGVTVRERAEVRNGRLVRRFRTSGEATVWFAIPAAGGVTATGGTREGSYFKFSGASAREFTIIMPLPAAPAP